MKTDIEFRSHGDVCRGWLFLPDSGQAPYPTVVMAGGWCYVKEIVMPHYAEAFADAGIASIVFDYRNCGASDGEPRQHLNPWEQIEDYRNALSFALTVDELDDDRLGVWGISYSGGHALILGAIDPRVKCLVSVVPVVDGYVNQQRVHGAARFQKVLSEIRLDREQRFLSPDVRATIPMHVPDPTQELCTWPFAESDVVFAHLKKTEAPRFETYSTLESIELLLNYTVFPFLDRILNIPSLMIVAEGDEKTLWDMEIRAFNQIATTEKKLAVMPRVSHLSLYSDMSDLQKAAGIAGAWLDQHLGQGSG
jgi:fermentation-respiration switch protein FrsA (DUF1100 family)